jgi:choline dehydrogenase-like flavoprotein
MPRVHLLGENVKTHMDVEARTREYGRISYHPGTCQMATNGLSVVDLQLQVRGFDGLRICDSSIIPSLIGSNTTRLRS